MNKHELITQQDLDIVGLLFGIRFTEGGSPNGLVELYIEDDGSYYNKMIFNHVWLNDLEAIVKKAKEYYNVS